MATSAKLRLRQGTPFTGAAAPSTPHEQNTNSSTSTGTPAHDSIQDNPQLDDPSQDLTQGDGLQQLLAFSTLYQQVRWKKPAADCLPAAGYVPESEYKDVEQFLLDEALQLVVERAEQITGADGVAIALAENNEIVLCAAAGTVRPGVGARIEPDSAFSGACLRTAQAVHCSDTETDTRVNAQACRHLGARSMVAVPLCGRSGAIGLLEAFSARPFAFNDHDVRNLSLLAQLVAGSLKPEDQDRLAEFAQAAATKLGTAPFLSAEAPNMPAASAIAMDQWDPTARNGTALERNDAQLEVRTPEIRTPEGNRMSRRPAMLVLLLCVGIATVFVGGIWWKIRTGRFNNPTARAVRRETSAPKSARTRAFETADLPTTAIASANPMPNSRPNLKTGAHSEAGPVSDPNLPSPAALRELVRFPRVTGIQHSSEADSSTVVLELEDKVQYDAHRLTAPDRIYVDLRDTQLASSLSPKTLLEVDGAQLRQIRVAQPVPGITRIVLVTKGAQDFSVNLQPNPYRLVIEMHNPPATR